MKKSIIILFATFIYNYTNGQLQYGVKAGLNYNLISINVKEGDSSNDIDNPSGFGFHIGGYASYSLNESLSVRPELLFSSCGTKEKSKTFSSNAGTTTTIESESTEKINYLEIPILADYAISENFSFQAGPSIGFLIGVKGEDTSTKTTKFSNGTSTTVKSSGSSSSKEGTNSLNLGLALGGIYHLDNGLNFGLRYQRGLNSINSDYTDVISYKWNIIQLSVGYTLNK